MPNNFIYLKEVDDSIIQEIKYASSENFIGKPLDGYNANECILQQEVASALNQLQNHIKDFSLSKLSPYPISLKVYDCYRPEKAQNQMYQWLFTNEEKQKNIYFPNIQKIKLKKFNFIQNESFFSTGYAISATLQRILNQTINPNQNQTFITKLNCLATYNERFIYDKSIDMGAGVDCFDFYAYLQYNKDYISFSNKKLFEILMQKFGFERLSEINSYDFIYTIDNKYILADKYDFNIISYQKDNNQYSKKN